MRSIRIATEIPGPRSRDLEKKATRTVARPVVPGGVYMQRGEGAVVEDVDGNRFLDFVGGVGCLIVGHSHPKIVAAAESQTRNFTHTDFSMIPYESYLQLAEELDRRCGGDRKAALFNSGAESVENAIKVARVTTGRPGVVCFEGAFHGRTYMALSLTHRDVPHKKGMGPFVPEVYRIPYPGFEGGTLSASLSGLELTISEHQIAAVIVEPILGEGGFIVPPAEFLGAISKRCRDAGAVLICDEIQTGYGRTGKFLASEHSGVRPDIVIVGKSIAAGLPLSGVIGDAGLMDSLEPNALGGTYVGNPVACAVGLAVLDVIDGEHLMERAVTIGDKLREGWAEADSRSGVIKEVRGVGSMIGVEFQSPDITQRLVREALQRGVMLMTAGKDRSVIRHLMPLVMSDYQLAEAFAALAEALEVAA